MLHLAILVRVARLLRRQEKIPAFEKRATSLSADIMASIPFHLAGNLEGYLQLVDNGVPLIPPGRPVGGLLLLHPLYAAARCTVIPRAHRVYFMDTLAWIGQNMGIGQATLLANNLRPSIEDITMLRTPKLPFMAMGEGHVLIWAGMMLESTSPIVRDSSKNVSEGRDV